jgi:hypothetical protein
MLKSIYDDQLLSLRNLKWLPWIGTNYAQNLPQNKILLIGESHYLGDNPNSKEDYENYNMTRLIVKDMAIDGNKGRSDFFPNTYKLLVTDKVYHDNNRHKFWNNVAFYNFIQTPMTNPKIRPQKHEIIEARLNFFDLLATLNPSVCIFLGLKAEQNLNESIKQAGYTVIEPILWKEEQINRCYGRYGIIEIPEEKRVKLIFVRHPSQYFSFGQWNIFLQKYIPEQLIWLNQIF